MYKANPEVKDYLEKHHGKVWTRSQFKQTCKVDYVTSNLVESFNAKIKKLKGLMVYEIFDKIRQMIMQKMVLRNKIANVHYVGHVIIPSVVKALHTRGRDIPKGTMSCLLTKPDVEAKVTYNDTKGGSYRYPVDLAKKECHCNRWQLTGKPCIHALYFLLVLGGEKGKVDHYVSEYFSVAKLRSAYADSVPSLRGKDQWEIVEPSIKLCPPVLTRPPGRPRKNRIRGSAEGTNIRRRKCKRCGLTGHIKRLCTNPVPMGFGEEGYEGVEEQEAAAAAAAAAKVAAAAVLARYVTLVFVCFMH